MEETNTPDQTPEPKPRRKNTFAAIADALLVPEKAFADPATFTARRIILFLLIFVTAVTGVLLTNRFHQNQVMHDLSYQMAERQIERLMSSASEEEIAAAKEAARDQIDSGQTAWIGYITAGITTGLFAYLYVLEIWVILILAAPFFGADEEPLDGKKHKRSNYLAFFAAIPYGLNALATGIILSFKDPSTIGNVLTLEEYTRQTDLSFSLVSLFGTPDIHPLLRYLLVNLTNPIYLWGLVVLFLGGRAVFKIKENSKLVGLVGVVFVILALQTWLFEAIGKVFTG